jgi:ATP/maltotriose-dependent transcriptional regulator MalT
MDAGRGREARLLCLLIAALQKAGAHIGKDVAAHLIVDIASGSRSVLEAIAGDLAEVQDRTVLFLDEIPACGARAQA